ncbi:MAG: YeeE/YedE family protein [Acidobacteria bacterium]|nr:YeeE/YedE family protein [Acidobacteriota bacterium]
MGNAKKTVNWKSYVFISLAMILAVLALSAYFHLPVLTAIPIGFLFGFFLQKGDLCGASAFSEVLVMKSWKKTWGIWVCVVAGMAGFAILDLLGLVTLAPKPFLWVNYLVGGILFGIGMVLSGGCISGSLYKAGIGHINSIVSLVGIPIGIALVEYGPLSKINGTLKTNVLKSSDGGSVTLSSLTGLPFWVVAVILILATLIVSAAKRPRSKPDRQSVADNAPAIKRAVTGSWKPWTAGLLIGILGGAAYLSSAASGRNYPLGVTHGVLHAQLMVTDSNLNVVYEKPDPAASSSASGPAQAPAAGKKVSLWLILIVISLVAGGWVSARLSGQARLIAKPPDQIFVALIGAILTGAGAAIATGCVIGNIMSGIALASVGMIFFTVITVVANWATTYLYLMGGSLTGGAIRSNE